MAPRSASQFLLFGGEEEVPEGAASAPQTPQPRERSASDPPEEKWEYPPGAFPSDPWQALYSLTVSEFEAAMGSSDAVRLALCRYFKRGLAASFDHGELIDLLCVSNDLLAEAGFRDTEVASILKDVLPAITEREIAATSLV
jgi:hypothetical protein